MDRLSCGRGRTKRSGGSANKSGRGKRELSTGGGGKGRIIPLRVYFYLGLQARFNCNRVLTSVSMPIYCLTADEVTSSCCQILVSSPLLGKTFRLLLSMYRVRRIQKTRKYPSPSACITKLYLQLVCLFVKWPLRTVFFFSDRGN